MTWKRAIPKWKKPTLVERFKALMRIRSAAKTLMLFMKVSPGGDEYTYTGSMNLVEDLQTAMDEYAGLYYRHAKDKE